MKDRTGRFILQPGGYRAFIPKPLPPHPPLRYTEELQSLLSQADRSLARLDGIITVLPNPDLFIAMYVKKEALLSSQIEGTQASLEGILEFEADLTPRDDIASVREVINYIKALDYGIGRLKDLPMSLRLIREIHRILIEGTRGSQRNPGEFRKSQNWIGPAGAPLSDAVFVPAPPEVVPQAMSDIETFLHAQDRIPPLVKIALVHAQFETVHPFLDGNGRVGRLLITFYLVWQEILSRPMLYLSVHLKRHRSQYYDLLMKVRTEGAWEEWIRFFLEGVVETSGEATSTAREIIALKEVMIARIYEHSISSIHAFRLIDLLFHKPLVNAADIVAGLALSKEAVSELIKRFEQAGLLTEISGKQRYRRYLFKPYVDLIARGTREQI
jgi:Fic family protein